MKMYVENNLTSVPIQHIELINANIETYTLELDGEGAFIANGLLAGQE